MKRFVQGEDRTQDTLLPRRLDDYIAEDNLVRLKDKWKAGVIAQRKKKDETDLES